MYNEKAGIKEYSDITHPDVLGDGMGIKLEMKIIAVVNRRIDNTPHDWAAYYGPTAWGDEKVAHGGEKLSKKVAEGLFPKIVAAGFVYRD